MLEKGYFRSCDTGDCVCQTCGDAEWGTDWPMSDHP